MDVIERENEFQELDESSWIYLSLWSGEQRLKNELHEQVVAACESNGWPAVSWSLPAHRGSPLDSARYFEGMCHAVEHADVVIAFVNGRSAMTDAELAFAYRHNRPVVGLRVGSPDGESAVQAMLEGYGRAWLVEAPDVEGCMAGLRQALADPALAAIVRDEAERSRDDD